MCIEHTCGQGSVPGVGGTEMERRDPCPQGILSLVERKDKETNNCEGPSRCHCGKRYKVSCEPQRGTKHV